jgi:hypothetical protein
MRQRVLILNTQMTDCRRLDERFSGAENVDVRRTGSWHSRAINTGHLLNFCRAKPWFRLQMGEKPVSGSKSALYWFSRTYGYKGRQEVLSGSALQFSGFLLEWVSW